MVAVQPDGIEPDPANASWYGVPFLRHLHHRRGQYERFGTPLSHQELEAPHGIKQIPVDRSLLLHSVTCPSIKLLRGLMMPKQFPDVQISATCFLLGQRYGGMGVPAGGIYLTGLKQLRL